MVAGRRRRPICAQAVVAAASMTTHTKQLNNVSKACTWAAYWLIESNANIKWMGLEESEQTYDII